jgi:hypothetical protein
MPFMRVISWGLKPARSHRISSGTPMVLSLTRPSTSSPNERLSGSRQMRLGVDRRGALGVAGGAEGEAHHVLVRLAEERHLVVHAGDEPGLGGLQGVAGGVGDLAEEVVRRGPWSARRGA